MAPRLRTAVVALLFVALAWGNAVSSALAPHLGAIDSRIGDRPVAAAALVVSGPSAGPLIGHAGLKRLSNERPECTSAIVAAGPVSWGFSAGTVAAAAARVARGDRRLSSLAPRAPPASA